jgi:GT2 family glycosyltransferase
MITYLELLNLIPTRFNAVEYRALNQDLRQLTLTEAAIHWKTRGKSEGRISGVSDMHVSQQTRKYIKNLLSSKALHTDLELDIHLLAHNYQVHRKEFGRLSKSSRAQQVCKDLNLPLAVVSLDAALTFAWIEGNAAEADCYSKLASELKGSSLNEFDNQLHLVLGLAPQFPTFIDPQLMMISSSCESTQEAFLKLFKLRVFQSLWIESSPKSLRWKLHYNVLANSNSYSVLAWKLKYHLLTFLNLFAKIKQIKKGCNKVLEKSGLEFKEGIKAYVPEVSIITSTYHAKRYLKSYLASISSLNQIEKYELIIIDANEDDIDYNFIVEHAPPNIRLKVIRTKKRINLYEALNMAILESESEFVAFAMTDDIRFVSSVEKQVDLLRRNLDLSIAYGDMLWSLQPNADSNLVRQIGIGSNLPDPTLYSLLSFCLPHCAPLWRREIHGQVGYFDESFQSAGDWDFWLRCVSADLKFGYIRQPLGIYYLNPGGLSTSSRASLPRLEAERVRSKNLSLFYEADKSIGRCDSN